MEEIKQKKSKIYIFFQLLSIIQWIFAILFSSGTTIVVVIIMPTINLFPIFLLGLLLFVGVVVLMIVAKILIEKKHQTSLKEQEITQTRNIEEQRRKDKREPLIRSLKKELKDFISFWENSRPKILENSQNLNIKQLNNIRALGDKAEKKNLDSGMFLSENIENEANEIIKDIKDFSMRIRVNVKTVGNDEVDTKRNQIIVKDGDILTIRVKEFIKKI